MSALPQLEPNAFRYAPYIDDLHDFFTHRGLSYGNPRDLVKLTERLDDPGTFHGDFRLMVRSIILREGGTLPRGTLLEIVAVAIGGPLVYKSSRQIRQPLIQLFEVLTSILRKPANLNPTPQAPRDRGLLLAFPEAFSEPPAAATLVTYPRPSEPAPAEPEPPIPVAPSFRTLLIAAATAALITFILALVLHPHSASAGTRPAAIRPATTAVRPPKPSAYGEAFAPTPQPARHHRAKPAPTLEAASVSDAAPNQQ